MDIADRVNRMAIDLDRLVTKAEIWQALFDECPLAVAVFTSEMKFYLINDEFTSMTGYSKDQISGEALNKVIPSKFRRIHKRAEKEFAGDPQKKVNRHGLSPLILVKSGEELPVDIDLSYIRYNGKIYYVAFIRRISR